ncbi:unnamed protein product, partial [Prorocentrum cordatum]
MKLENLEKAYQMRPEARGTVKVLMDTRGPEIRTGYFKVYNSKKVLEAGQEFKLVTDYSVKGDENHVAITYSRLPKDITRHQGGPADLGAGRHCHSRRHVDGRRLRYVQ